MALHHFAEAHVQQTLAHPIDLSGNLYDYEDKKNHLQTIMLFGEQLSCSYQSTLGDLIVAEELENLLQHAFGKLLEFHHCATVCYVLVTTVCLSSCTFESVCGLSCVVGIRNVNAPSGTIFGFPNKNNIQ